MLGPDAAIALVRDQNPVRVAKVRYYEDGALTGPSSGRPREYPLESSGSDARDELSPHSARARPDLGRRGDCNAVASADPREADPKAQSDAREEPPAGSDSSSSQQLISISRLPRRCGRWSGDGSFFCRQVLVRSHPTQGILGGQDGLKEEFRLIGRALSLALPRQWKVPEAFWSETMA